jgi:4-hydroxy-2-oxoglutarate aldolase
MLTATSTTNTAALISASTLTQTSATAIAEPPPMAPPLRTRAKSVGFQIISCTTIKALDDLNSGTVGIAPAFAAAAPQACYEVFAAWKDLDQPLAAEKQLRLREAARLAEENPGLLKFACDLNGYFGGLPRLPHLPPTGEQRAALQSLMEGIRS